MGEFDHEITLLALEARKSNNRAAPAFVVKVRDFEVAVLARTILISYINMRKPKHVPRNEDATLTAARKPGTAQHLGVESVM